MTLNNNIVRIKYNPNATYTPSIFTLDDVTDEYNNQTKAYNTNKRGHGKAWEALQEAFSNKMTISQAIQVLNDNNLKMHMYCARD